MFAETTRPTNSRTISIVIHVVVEVASEPLPRELVFTPPIDSNGLDRRQLAKLAEAAIAKALNIGPARA